MTDKSDLVRAYLAEVCGWPPGEVPPDDELIDAAERLFCADKGDPIAALEAAERRLLEVGGWQERGDFWSSSGPGWGIVQNKSDALATERRRRAQAGR